MNNAQEEALNRFPPWWPVDDQEDYDEDSARWQNEEAEIQRAAFIAGATWQSRQEPQFTDRQVAAWPEAIAEAQRYVTTGGVPEELFYWYVNWREETRPGRGHDIDAHWSDGEYFVHITMDVYGHYTVSVAETEWLHSSAWEECECNYCEREREDDE